MNDVILHHEMVYPSIITFIFIGYGSFHTILSGGRPRGDSRGLNTYPVDHAGLIFDQRRWKIKMDENGEDLRISGCMDKVNQSAKEQKSEI